MASIAIVVLRSSWPCDLETLLVPPQTLRFVPARTGKVDVVRTSVASRTCLFDTPRNTVIKCFRNGEFPESLSFEWEILHLPRLCLIDVHVFRLDFQRRMSGQHIHSRNLEHRFLYFTGPSSPSLVLRSLFPLLSPFTDKTYRVTYLLSNRFTVVLVMTVLDGVNGTVCNAQQYLQSLQSHDSPSPSISCLTHGECIGLVVSI